MKKLLVVLALVFVGSTINAQEATAAGKKPAKVKATAEQRAQKSVDNLDKAVTLAPEQKTQVYDLALIRAKKVDAIREANKGKKTPEEREAMKKEIKAAHKEYRDGVKLILTQEQKDKLKAKAKERKAAKANKKPNKMSKKAEETKNDVSEDEIDEVISTEE